MALAWIICYDVANPGRCLRARRRVCRHAMPLQESVFWFVGTDTQRSECLREIREVLDPSLDDLRCYAVPTRGVLLHLGVAVLPEGILWSGASEAAWSRKIDALELQASAAAPMAGGIAREARS